MFFGYSRMARLPTLVPLRERSTTTTECIPKLPERIEDIKNETRSLTTKIDYVEKTVDRMHETFVCF